MAFAWVKQRGIMPIAAELVSREAIGLVGPSGRLWVSIRVALRFEWDERKATANARKHGVCFTEAASVFADPLAALFDDEAHSAQESREIMVGHSTDGRLLIVSFAERGDVIRIISAREATNHERRDYEERPIG